MKRASIEAIVRALNDASVIFMVVRGLAVVTHSYGRQTHDVDIVVRLDPVYARSALARATAEMDGSNFAVARMYPDVATAKLVVAV